MLEPKFEDICLYQKKLSLLDRKKIECKTEVSVDNITRILNIHLKPIITKSQVLNGVIEYDGVATFFVCYIDKDGKIRKCECNSEFSGNIKSADITECCFASLYAVDCRSEADTSLTMLNLSGSILITAMVNEKKMVSVLSNSQDLICNHKEIDIAKSYGVRESVYPIQEDFEVLGVVEEVICQQAEAQITSVACGVGSIIVDGNVYFQAIFLQSEEKKDIIKETKVSPFRIEIDYPECMPTMNAFARVWAKSLKTEISVDANKNLSQVSCTIVLRLEGEAYTTESIPVIADAFSKTHNLEVIDREIIHHMPNKIEGSQMVVKAVAQTEELPVGTMLVCSFGERAEIVSTEKIENGISVAGLTSIEGLFRDIDGNLFTRKLEAPFVAEVNCSKLAYEDVLCLATSGTLKMVSATELEITCQLAFTIYSWQENSQRFITAVNVLGEKQPNGFAISVYLPTVNEDLWALSKRLNTSPEELLETNPELQFPLSGKERIVVFRGK